MEEKPILLIPLTKKKVSILGNPMQRERRREMGI